MPQLVQRQIAVIQTAEGDTEVKDWTMKSLNSKLVLSALGIALLATPAFAQKPTYRQQATTQYPQYKETYPNPQVHSGSALSREMGDDSIGGE